MSEANQTHHNLHPDNKRLVDPLTKRESEIIALLAERLTDREISQELHIGVGTVRWYNQQIYDKLGVRGRQQAVERARELGLLESRAPALLQTFGVFPEQVAPFVGRRKELAEITQLLQNVRLLTLTGLGGIGKTRLGLQVVAQVREQYPDGVYFIPLADIIDPSLVADSLSRAVGVGDSPNISLEKKLQQYLKNKHALLMFDNFEHVMPATSLISSLLTGTSQMTILVTSRELLKLYGEQAYPVPPLRLPTIESLDNTAALMDCDSVELFVHRVQAVKPDFKLTDENSYTIAEICVQLEGWPIALELAAAHSRLLTPQAILDRIRKPLDTLVLGASDMPRRLQTLRNTLDWSYSLLEVDEQHLFARLAVFWGGCSLDAVEVICSENLPQGGYDSLLALVDKSLVQQVAGVAGGPRFSMLRTIHQYAEELLDAIPENETIRNKHAEYFLALAEKIEPELHQAHMFLWLDRLEQEHANFRSALTWSMEEGDETIALRLAGALGWFWYLNSHFSEGQKWLEMTLDKRRIESSAEAAKVLNILGRFLFDQGNYSQAKLALEEALTISRKTSLLQEAWANGYLAMVTRAFENNPEKIDTLQSNALEIFQELGDHIGQTWQLNSMGETSRHSGDYPTAKTLYMKSLGEAQRNGNLHGVHRARSNLARTLLHLGEYEQARQLLMDCLLPAYTFFTGEGLVAGTLASLAWALILIEKPKQAACLSGAAETIFRNIGTQMNVVDLSEHQQYMAILQEQLKPEAFEAAWEKGQVMSPEQAVAYALDTAAE